MAALYLFLGRSDCREHRKAIGNGFFGKDAQRLNGCMHHGTGRMLGNLITTCNLHYSNKAENCCFVSTYYILWCAGQVTTSHLRFTAEKSRTHRFHYWGFWSPCRMVGFEKVLCRLSIGDRRLHYTVLYLELEETRRSFEVFVSCEDLQIWVDGADKGRVNLSLNRSMLFILNVK